MVSHNPVSFGGHGHCGIRNVIALADYVSSQDYTIKESCDFMSRTPSR